jgi:hypothetical protein
MENLRKVCDNDILSDWLFSRDEKLCCNLSTEDKKHNIEFDEISETIINNIPKQNRKLVQRQLNKLDDNIMDYICYWNEKYYRNGFCDGVELINGCIRK